MFCSKCGQQCPDNSAFCPSCGSPVQTAQTQSFQQSGGAEYENTQPELTGLGGWLILVGIGLVICVPVYCLHISAGFLLKSIVLYVPANLLALVLCGFAIYLFFTKSRKFPTVFIVFMVANAVTAAISGANIGIYSGRESSAWILGGIGGVLGLIVAAIWIPYTLKSKRVKNTFVN
ncbi:MAG: DUF2569 family protein [Zoogloeaceae bacterium]|jgi:hypothetical protein|nr:DUF2569 family protein [Zoogloeaceae bacterium]